MRVLLIDNYDSYTYNLAHLIAQVCRVAPTIVRNDAWTLDQIARFDPAAIVLSPGPGRPGVPRDLGVGAQVLAHYPGPILGVCLGHQGIVWASGGRVVRAPEPMHGRITALRHDGRGLFHGLPDGLPVVRYHSLIAQDPLPDGLEVSARADDGTIMALRDRTGRRFGLQFHPESVGTPHGRAMLTAFFRHVATLKPSQWSAPAPQPPTPPPPRPVVPIAAILPPLRLVARRLSGPLDPERTFLGRFSGRPGAFWLDSSGRQGAGPSRWSYVGASDGPAGCTITWRVGGAPRVHRPGQAPQAIDGDPLCALRMPRLTPSPELPFGFLGGWVGWLGHGAGALDGAPSGPPSALPDLAFAFCDRLVAFDHDDRCAWAVCLVPDGEDAPAALDAFIASLTDLPTPTAPGPPEPGALLPEHDQSAYLAQIERAQAQIIAGESYEICLTQRLRGPPLTRPTCAYRRLRQRNPAPYGAYLELAGAHVLSSSPEQFLAVDRARVATARPIKGTRARHTCPSADADAAHALAISIKDRAENLMIVDLLRNDLGRVCTWGSIDVPSLMAVEPFPTVHQLVSTITGELRPECDAIDALRAAFPPGSMTGAPKHRTLEILEQLETSARGPYGGALGWISVDGAMGFSVVIRTAIVTDDATEVGIGGAITALSSPIEEWEEARLKGRALEEALVQPIAE